MFLNVLPTLIEDNVLNVKFSALIKPKKRCEAYKSFKTSVQGESITTTLLSNQSHLFVYCFKPKKAHEQIEAENTSKGFHTTLSNNVERKERGERASKVIL